jgi:trehalose 6-phosphate phosphatase
LIDALTRALSGRFAVVSGRSLADIDRVLEHRVAAVAAVHGLVRRNADGRLVESAVGAPAMAAALEAVNTFATNHDGLIVEDKGSAVALHYRQSPGAAAASRTLVRHLAADFALQVQEGDMVVELKSPGPDKGGAVQAFMAEPPFAGYMPIFLGDDFTDESGFHAVQGLRGFGVIVGARRPTTATYALADVGAARTWLQQAVEAAPK